MQYPSPGLGPGPRPGRRTSARQEEEQSDQQIIEGEGVHSDILIFIIVSHYRYQVPGTRYQVPTRYHLVPLGTYLPTTWKLLNTWNQSPPRA